VSFLAALAGALLFARTLRRLNRGETGTPVGALVGALALVTLGFTGGLLLMGAATVRSPAGAAMAPPAERARGGLVGSEAPLLAWTRLEGGKDTLAAHRGKVVLVNYWATWCGPCRREMPALERLQRDYRDRGLVVVHLSREDEATIRRFLSDFPSQNEHGREPHTRLVSNSLPTTYLIDRDGIVRGVLVGARSYADFESAVRAWL